MSYLSPKTEVRASPIHGKGLFAVAPIPQGDIVCVKGGYIFNRQTLKVVAPSLGPAEIQMGDDLFIGPLRAEIHLIFGDSMLSYEIYKLIHLFGIIMLFVSVGGVMLYALNGGTKADNTLRKTAAITHGIGLVFILVAGFGLLARVGISWPWPGWVFVKLIIWLVLGGITGLIYKLGAAGKGLWYVVILLGVIAAYMAIFKPF